MASTKSHKGMSDADWLARLESFARTGVWPSREGNRPSPRQKRWHELYQKVNYAARFMGELINLYDNTLCYLYLCVWISNYLQCKYNVILI
jgi:hypothetical protein